VEVREHPIFEPTDLLCEVRVREEDGRVREIDHQLG
jgi:hypothetical protein